MGVVLVVKVAIALSFTKMYCGLLNKQLSRLSSNEKLLLWPIL
jgi:hypothetical protein